MIRKTAAVTAASIAGVVLAGTAAVGANIGILDAADDNGLGTLSAEATMSATAEPAHTTVRSDPSPTTSETVSADANGTPRVQTFAVDAAGTIDVELDDDGLHVKAVDANDGWSWKEIDREPGTLAVTFTSGDETLEFLAALTPDGSIAARVDRPVVTQRPAPAPASSATASPAPASPPAPTAGYDDDDTSTGTTTRTTTSTSTRTTTTRTSTRTTTRTSTKATTTMTDRADGALPRHQESAPPTSSPRPDHTHRRHRPQHDDDVRHRRRARRRRGVAGTNPVGRHDPHDEPDDRGRSGHDHGGGVRSHDHPPRPRHDDRPGHRTVQRTHPAERQPRRPGRRSPRGSDRELGSGPGPRAPATSTGSEHQWQSLRPGSGSWPARPR